MSNAMRTSKRLLAGVAAGALGLALVPFVATGASAAGTIAGSVSPVRSADFGTVPPALLSWTSNSIGASTLSLTTAPTAAARLHADDSTALFAQLNAPATIPSGAINAGTNQTLELNATVAGLYVGALADGTDTVTFSFTTTGAPASITLTPATQTVLVGAPATMTLTVRDASGNTTQPALVDTIALSDNTDDTVSPTSVNAAALATGTATATLTTTGNPAGTTTVTATPQGTLPGLGVVAATATVTKAGTVSSTAIAGISVTTPANAVNAGTFPAKTAAVPAGTATVTVTVDDTTAATAGNTIRVGVNSSSGTVNGAAYLNGDDTLYLDLTTDANKKAATTLTLGGTARLSGQTLTVQQVDVLDAQVGTVALVVTQATPAITAASVTVSPDDSVVAQLGATTSVQVTVKDQFGTVASGYGVSAYRGTTVPGNLTTGFLSNATTNASGVATVTVTSATGAAVNALEQYSFAVFTPIGAHIAGADKNSALQITYTADGTITSLSVAVAGGALTPITDTTTAITTAPIVGVPASGTAETQSTATYTVATGVASGAANGGVAAFTPTATPLNNVTVTAPEGLFVSTDASTAWDEGDSSVTVSSGTAVYAFGLVAGDYDLAFTSGGKTTTTKVRVTTAAANAYNIAISPAEQAIPTGGFATATVAVTDVFGNPVAGTSDDTGGVTVSASGAVLLGGFNATQKVNTNASGVATVTIIGANTVGEGLLTAVPTNGTATSNALAFRPAYTPPTNAPAPVLSAVAVVGVGEAPVVPTILIDGSRDGQRIDVDGVTFSIAEGTEVYPFIRFPGQTGFTQGTAVRTVVIVDEDEQIGEFFWGRNTGKRTAVQFRDADGLRSNTIIIAAR